MWELKVLACLLAMSRAHRLDPGCPEVCDRSRCPPDPAFCYFGVVRDACRCCIVCAPGEGDPCGERGRARCGEGLRCDRTQGQDRRRCACVSVGPVCGSNRRTYASVCRLRAENRKAERSRAPTVIPVQKGECESGPQNPSSMRFKYNFIADVVDRIAPAVVHLELFRRLPYENQEVPESTGSGFIVSEDGWIVTNAHVLSNKQRINVELNSGLHYDATIRDLDQNLDIALIKIDSEIVNLNYEMKEKNPINALRFYSKTDKDKAEKLPKEEVFVLLPERFAETKIMLFYKPSRSKWNICEKLNKTDIEAFWKAIEAFD